MHFTSIERTVISRDMFSVISLYFIMPLKLCTCDYNWGVALGRMANRAPTNLEYVSYLLQNQLVMCSNREIVPLVL